MLLTKVFPSPALQAFVRHYLYREVSVGDAVVVRPLRARSDPFLAFHIGHPYEVYEYGTGAVRMLPRAFVVGPQTARLADLRLMGRLAVFFVSFQPAGLHRLFPCRMTELTNRAYDAVDVIGRAATAITERLNEASDVNEMVRVVEGVLLGRVRAARPAHPLDDAAAMTIGANGRVEVRDLATASGLSERQFERRFIDRIGVTPKLYSRIVRFNHAVRLKERQPRLSWSTVSHEAGYFDQMHLVKDFKAFAGDPPAAFLRSLAAAGEVFPPEPT